MLKIALLNLMPNKETTEADFRRALSESVEPVEFILTRMGSHVTRHCSDEHMALYRTTDEVRRGHDDGSCPIGGLVWTGAPFDWVFFDDVDYWPEACALMDWLRERRIPTLYVCWGAQAALYHFHHIGRHEEYPHKLSGIFTQEVLDKECPLFDGIEYPLCIPHSRHTEMNNDEIDRCPDVRILARSAETGISIIECHDGLEFYLVGHQEYALDTLDNEYHRDLSRGLPVHAPLHYYRNEDPTQPIVDTWQQNGKRVYANWIVRYVLGLKVKGGKG